jgi:hypothetical protein
MMKIAFTNSVRRDVSLLRIECDDVRIVPSALDSLTDCAEKSYHVVRPSGFGFN